jgi:hypothetical protein
MTDEHIKCCLNPSNYIHTYLENRCKPISPEIEKIMDDKLQVLLKCRKEIYGLINLHDLIGRERIESLLFAGFIFQSVELQQLLCIVSEQKRALLEIRGIERVKDMFNALFNYAYITPLVAQINEGNINMAYEELKTERESRVCPTLDKYLSILPKEINLIIFEYLALL